MLWTGNPDRATQVFLWGCVALGLGLISWLSVRALIDVYSGQACVGGATSCTAWQRKAIVVGPIASILTLLTIVQTFRVSFWTTAIYAVTNHRALKIGGVNPFARTASVNLSESDCEETYVSIVFFKGSEAALTFFALSPDDRRAVLAAVVGVGTTGISANTAEAASKLTRPAGHVPVASSPIDRQLVEACLADEVELWRGRPVEAGLFALQRLSFGFGISCFVLVVSMLFALVLAVGGNGAGLAFAVLLTSAGAALGIQLRTRARMRSTEYLVTNVRARILWKSWLGEPFAESWRIAPDSPIELKRGYPYDVIVATRRVKSQGQWVLESVAFQEVADGPEVFQILTELKQKLAE